MSAEAYMVSRANRWVAQGTAWFRHDDGDYLRGPNPVPSGYEYFGAEMDGMASEAGPACQIRNQECGDTPWLHCLSSIFQSGSRQYLPILANYTPNLELGPFYFYAVAYDDGFVTIYNDEPEVSPIAAAAQAICDEEMEEPAYREDVDHDLYLWYVRHSEAWCERLAFISNMKTADSISDPDCLFGWICPGQRYGEENRNNPSLPAAEMTYRRVVTPNPNLSLSAAAGVEQDGIPPWIGSENWPPPNNPYHPCPAAERWTYVPSILGRSGDIPINSIPGPVTIYTTTYAYDVSTPQGWKDYYKGTSTPVVNSTSTTLSAGQYDWRFLCSIGRKRFTSLVGGTLTITVIQHLFYWDALGAKDSLPTGATANQIGTKIRAIALENGIPKDTAFDVRIQAGIFQRRANPELIPELVSAGYDSDMFVLGTPQSWYFRMWDYTKYKVMIRQAMPCKCV